MRDQTSLLLVALDGPIRKPFAAITQLTIVYIY